MKIIRNERGVALVTALLITMISLVIVIGVLYMVIQNTDMADSCQEPNRSLPNCFSAVFFAVIFQGTCRGGTHVATVDHSDIRGLDTA